METLEQSLARFFPGADRIAHRPSISQEAVRRAYGSIFGNHGRRTAVRAAAEVYLASYWHHKVVRDCINDLLRAIEWASKLRDDISPWHSPNGSHLRQAGNLQIPRRVFDAAVYNTAFTHARAQLKADIF